MATQKRLLLVEDDAKFAAVLKKQLVARDLNVVVVTDGSQAGRMVDSEAFDCIVTAVKLPGTNGLQVVAFAKSSSLNRVTPTFVLATVLDDDTAARASRLSVKKVFVKPVDANEIVTAVAAAMQDVRRSKSYDVRIINCFLAAATDVLGFYVGKPPTLGKPTIKTDPTSAGYVTGLIDFVGKRLSGSMSVSFGREFVEKLAAAVFQGASPQLDDTMIADLSAEMANQLCGKVKINVAQLGYKVQIGLPKVVLGDDHRVVHKSKNPVLAVPISVDAIKCLLEFTMEEIEGVAEPEVEPAQDMGSVILFE